MNKSFEHITTLQEIEWELKVYQKQYDRCKIAIETGNWEGYPESLKGRKETLNILKDIVQLFKNKKQRYETDFKKNRD
jgi:hypothetical protein